MKLSEVFLNAAPTMAINEFTGKVVRVDEHGVVSYLVKPDLDCRFTLCSLLFDEETVNRAWVPIDKVDVEKMEEIAYQVWTPLSPDELDEMISAT